MEPESTPSHEANSERKLDTWNMEPHTRILVGLEKNRVLWWSPIATLITKFEAEVQSKVWAYGSTNQAAA